MICRLSRDGVASVRIEPLSGPLQSKSASLEARKNPQLLLIHGTATLCANTKTARLLSTRSHWSRAFKTLAPASNYSSSYAARQRRMESCQNLHSMLHGHKTTSATRAWELPSGSPMQTHTLQARTLDQAAPQKRLGEQVFTD